VKKGVRGSPRLSFCPAELSSERNYYCAIALTKLAPLGVPSPSPRSQPKSVVSEEPTLKAITNQRVEKKLQAEGGPFIERRLQRLRPWN
jgi:hypothetical protein